MNSLDSILMPPPKLPEKNKTSNFTATSMTTPTPTPPLSTTNSTEYTPPKIWENPSTLTRRRDTYPFIDPFRFRNKLKGKIVLITYAHRGIGRATALAFAAAGATLVLIARPTDSLSAVVREIKERFSGGGGDGDNRVTTFPITADLLDPSVPGRIVRLVEEELGGGIDVLVNITPSSYLRPFAQEPGLTDWWTTVEHQLRVPVSLTHAVLPSMTARGTGTIISTTSLSSHLQIPFMTAQSVSKTALLKFHHQLHIENHQKGILSFCVSPGLQPTHIHDPTNSATRVGTRPADFEVEPRMRTELLEGIGRHEWAATGLAADTFVALVADPRCAVLSGLYVNAARDLGEVIAVVERDREKGGGEGRVERERLYVLKIDEL